MNHPTHRLVPSALAVLLSLAGTAQAQDAAPEAQQLAQNESRRVIVNESIDLDLGGLPGGVSGGERVVKGAPYCADAVHESVQWLQNDGSGAAPNRIVRQITTRQCRDGEGRTRQEFDSAGRKLVYLRDPVARESWVLDPERKTARRSGGGMVQLGNLGSIGHLSGSAQFDSGAWRDYAERMREWARGMADRARGREGVAPVAPVPPSPPSPAMAPTPPAPPTPPQPVVITRIERVNGGGEREAEVRLLRPEAGAPLPPLPEGEMMALPPAVQWRAQTLAPRGAGTVSPLPAKDIDGVRVNGERTTWVIEAGKLGNERPIQITREVWTSPELMITVSSRDFDPRSGEQNYRLRNLKRGEPEAALMRVPADYAKPAPRSAPRASGAATG
jgi:hypothetical protein